MGVVWQSGGEHSLEGDDVVETCQGSVERSIRGESEKHRLGGWTLLHYRMSDITQRIEERGGSSASRWQLKWEVLVIRLESVLDYWKEDCNGGKTRRLNLVETSRSITRISLVENWPLAAWTHTLDMSWYMLLLVAGS
ncbi:hypothetical protein Tco_0974277 [Tanacetum coccineum]|uniref:Uncharacterized protein n=1 Tax=Tanacetum coccineum TaxID=301880 RepID=A0ABQ5EB44_9ASTR